MKPLYMERATSGINYSSIYSIKFEIISFVALWDHDNPETATFTIFGPGNVLSDASMMKKGAIDISNMPEHLHEFIKFAFTGRIIRS